MGDKINDVTYRRDLLPDEVALMPKNLGQVYSIFTNAGYEIYLVGAGVRNILTGKVPINCDLTTNATPEITQELMKEFDPFYENDFGMVGVPMGDDVYEITTFRSEKGYSDFRRPDVVNWGNTLEEDVQRRDFTMNAVVIGPKKEGGSFELIDHVGGLKDFEAGIIRTVGDPEARFGEDALRMMRAIRFAATLSFQIEPATLEAVAKKAPLLSKISRERVRDEFWKILKSQYAGDGVRLLISTGLMEFIIPEVLEAQGIEQTGHHTLDVLNHMISALENCPSSDPLIRLATFLHDVGKPRTKRWRCIKCGSNLRETDLNEDGRLYCKHCGTTQSTKDATTFYGHEVVGARMAGEIAERLRLTKKEKEKLVTLVRWHMFAYQPEMTDAAIRRFIKNVGKENINDMLLLRIGDRKGWGSKTTSWRLMELQKRIGEQLYEPMEINDMAVNGKDVMEVLGIPPGPKIGEVLRTLFEEVLEDTSKNNREYLLERIKQLK